MMMRVLALLVFLALIGGALYLWLHRGGGGPDGIAELSSRLPKNSALAVVVDYRQEVDLSRELQSLRETLKDNSEAQKALAEAEGALGCKLEEIANWAQPAFFAALLPPAGAANLWTALPEWQRPLVPPSARPALVVGAPVKDEKQAQAFLLRLLQKEGKPVEENVNGSVFYVVNEARLGVVHGFVVLASSRPALEGWLPLLDGKGENLTGQASFQQMRKKLAHHQGVLAYMPLDGLGAALQTSLGSAQFDEQSLQNLNSLLYLAGSVARRDGVQEMTALLGVKPDSDTSLARTLLTPPASPLVGSKLVPAEWNYYSSLNARYFFNVILELARLSPQARAQIATGLPQAQALSGVNLDNDLWQAFTGEIAWSGNFLSKMPEFFQSNFQQARSAGQLTACKSNLKNIGTACEMYCTDYAGRYPESLALLTPQYLRQIPSCPVAGTDTYSAGFQSAAAPDLFTVVCQGHNHGGTGDWPQYSAMEGLLLGDLPPQAQAARNPAVPSVVLLAGVKNAEKAQQLLGRVDAFAPFQATRKLGNVQLYEFKGRVGVARAMFTRPEPMLAVAVGPDAAELIQACAEARNPVADLSEFKSVRSDHSEAWVSESYLDLKGLLDVLNSTLAQAPPGPEQKVMRQLLGGVKDARGVGYTVVEKDGVRLVSRGNAALASGSTAVAAAILVPNFIKARSQGQLTACKSNEKNIATALEMYSTDHQGHYPSSLQELTPEYLRVVPTCPAARSDTYSQSYEVTTNPDMFSFCCSGHSHQSAGLAPDRPAYNAMQGLLDR